MEEVHDSKAWTKNKFLLNYNVIKSKMMALRILDFENSQ